MRVGGKVLQQANNVVRLAAARVKSGPRICLVWAFVLLTSVASWSQQQSFRRYGAGEGLSNLSIRCLLQDKTGFLWVGTDNGLFRFDGSDFREFAHEDGLPSTEIYALAESPTTSQLWVSTSSGLARYDGSRFLVQSMPPGSAAPPFRQIAFDQRGRFYLLGSSGILTGTPDDDGGYSFRVLVPGDVDSMLIEDDSVYFGTESDLWHLRGERREPVGASFGLPKSRWGAAIRDSFGNLWLRSETQLFELRSDATRFVDRSTGVPHTIDPHLSVDSEGRVYVSTLSGVFVYDGQTESILDKKHGLPAVAISPTLVDRNGTLWLGTAGAGLVRRLGHGEWSSWTKDSGLAGDSVWAIYRDSEKQVWVGTDGGLTLLRSDGTVKKTWTTTTGLLSDRILAIQQAPSGDVFAGLDPVGLAQFSASGKLQRTYGANEGLTHRVSAMAIDGTGALWLVGGNEVLRGSPDLVAGTAAHLQPIKGLEIPKDAILRDVVATPDGSVWIAGSRGLLRYKSGHWRTFTTHDGLLSEDLSVVAERNGTIWLAYRDAIGLTNFTIAGTKLLMDSVSTKNGLSSDGVYALAFDGLGRLWVSTDKGVDLLSNDRWRHFSSEDGLIWDDTNGRALTIDDEDNAWIGTSAGMSRYSRPVVQWTLRPPVPLLTTINAAGRAWRTSDAPVLPYLNQGISFRFAALDASAGRPVFRYKMSGYDKAWTDTNDRTVKYAALPAGRYLFQVSILGSSAPPAMFSFSIAVPWWRKWYWLLAGSGIIVLTCYALWRVRVKFLIEQQKRLQSVVDLQTTELRKRQIQLETMAYLDQLTALPNRRRFQDKLRAYIERAKLTQTTFALLLIDLDKFKLINDTWGHDAGDKVLVSTAARMRSVVPQDGTVARLGGDEFAILLGKDDGEVAISALCNQLQESCTQPIEFHGERLHVGCSIGIASFPTDGQTEEHLYKAADLALYEVKRSTRAGFCWSRDRVPGLVDQMAQQRK